MQYGPRILAGSGCERTNTGQHLIEDGWCVQCGMEVGMRILALDVATKCGWAHSCGESGTWDLSIRRDESAGMRLLRFRAKLAEVHKLIGFDVAVFEAARHAAPRMQGALTVQAEIQSVLKVWCEDNGVEYRGYSPSEIKKRATGKGGANKAAMMEAAKKRWPGVDDENQVDALWLLDLALSELCVIEQRAQGRTS